MCDYIKCRHYVNFKIFRLVKMSCFLNSCGRLYKEYKRYLFYFYIEFWPNKISFIHYKDKKKWRDVIVIKYFMLASAVRRKRISIKKNSLLSLIKRFFYRSGKSIFKYRWYFLYASKKRSCIDFSNHFLLWRNCISLIYWK